MGSFLALVLVLTLATAYALPGKELRSRNVLVPAGQLKGRITGGQDAREGKFPYQAGIAIYYNETSSKWCGGTLLHHEWVLTAAHCIDSAKEIVVVLGAVNRLEAPVGEDVSKENMFVHEGYSVKKTVKNDIALIKIPYTNYTKNIKPATLADLDVDLSNKYAIASGWGRTGNRPQDQTDLLKWARLRIIYPDVCKLSYVGILDNKFCTDTVGGTNICNGDSGGPLVLENTDILIGVTSYYNQDCTKPYPSVHTRVSKYLDWIVKTTNGAVAVKKTPSKGNLKAVPPRVDLQKIRQRGA